MKISHRTYCMVVICLAWYLLAAQSFAQTGTTANNTTTGQMQSGAAPGIVAGEDPDVPSFAQGEVDKQSYLQNAPSTS